MRHSFLILVIFPLLILGYENDKNVQNHFSSISDTLVIEMQQFPGKGYAKISRSIHKLRFKNSLDYDVILPENIDSIMLASEVVSYDVWNYKRILSEGHQPWKEYPYYQDLIENNKLDTANLPSKKENSVCFLKGIQNGKEVFIVDENFNKDFRDDSIRVKKPMATNPKKELIKCNFMVYDGKEYIITSNWINVGEWKFDRGPLYYLAAQHYLADFSIDKTNYKLEYFIDDSRFNFIEPTFALIEYNGIKVDSVTDAEMLQLNEYLKLDYDYYKISDLSTDGKYVTLVKEYDFESKSGLQVGNLAPNFNCVTIDGDSISSNDFKSKYLLITNVSACYSKISSYECYKDLTDFYENKIDALCLDKSPVILKNNIKHLELNGHFVDVTQNNMIESYRPEFCSRTCYLVHPNGRIIDKFEIFDWKESLEKHFK